MSAMDLVQQLMAGEPNVHVGTSGIYEGVFTMSPMCLREGEGEGEGETIASRMRARVKLKSSYPIQTVEEWEWKWYLTRQTSGSTCHLAHLIPMAMCDGTFRSTLS